ncbi:MAG: FG-GAP repeat protein [Sandaracinaceae bacterium]|nr:FG-GAP repeat protein [Sandaracinaceae bacterium]
MRARRTSLGLGAVALAATGVGCHTWDDFQSLSRTASVTTVEVEGDGGPRFGTVLFGYEVPVMRDSFVRGTRLYVGGNSVRSETQGSYAVFRIWDEVRPGMPMEAIDTVVEHDRGDRATVPPAFRGCHSEDREAGSTVVNCGSGRRAGAGFPYMHTATPMDWWGCVAVTAGVFNTQERVQVRCESIGAQMSLMLPVENGLGWGSSAAGVPIDHPFGVAIFGAPDTDGQGAIFRLRHLVDQQRGLGMGQLDGGARRGIIPIAGLELSDGARLGSNVALTVDRSATTPVIRFAATMGTDTRRVVVAEVTAATGDSVSAQVIGCLAGSTDDVGFGDALAFGDFDGDGHPDLAVGSQPTDSSALPLDRPVQIFDGADFGGDTCSLTTPSSARAAGTFGCLPNARGTEVSCESSRFGHALAAGDLDGDGRDDLAVGAPGASTNREGAGVVQTIPGTAMLAQMGQDMARRGTLWLSSSNESAAFGSAVAAIPAPFGRSDLAASQAAPAVTHVFYCSDLTGDTPSSVMATGGASIVNGCGMRPGRTTSTMLDPLTVPGGSSVRTDAGMPDASAPEPDAGVGDDAGEGVDAGG